MNPAQSYVATRGLRGERVVCPDADQLVDHLAIELLAAANRHARKRGTFHLALSGGSTPVLLYRRLMFDPRFRDFPWPKTHIWLVDDRCVEHDDELSNYKMIRELVVDQVTIPESHVHPMPVLDDDGDQTYEDELRSALDTPESRNRLDFVLLGMGADGHTASLFPGSPALTEHDRWVVFNDGPTVTPPRPRMTMTYALLNAARSIAILVTSQTKHATIQRVSLTPNDTDRFPITGIDPTHEDAELTWYLDLPAAVGPRAAEADGDAANL